MSETLEVTTVPEWTLGWRMQRALAVSGLTAQQMAAELGVQRGTVSRWMNDRGSPPKLAYLKQWAAYSHVPLEWLTEESTQVSIRKWRSSHPNRRREDRLLYPVICAA